ncbi:MAG: DUF1156 domain-containing protein [Planctomycetota bacterium]|nr:MAG: DUF1156 domain-containing protein [Planctomycetota bacterium]
MTTASKNKQVNSPANQNGLPPFSLKDAPSLIEQVLPVQKLSIESYKEKMSSHAQVLVSLGGYWKGRKPLVLNKACILGCLLPASQDAIKDLEIFELLMGMDDVTMASRLVASKKLGLGESLPKQSYRQHVADAKRPEEIGDQLFDPIWPRVNAHIGTTASSFPELVEQLGVARFGHRPVVADTFCGSGQIPFEAARLGCDVVASDLNPAACMLTWGAMHIVGGNSKARRELLAEQHRIAEEVREIIDELGVESAEFDGKAWRGKTYLYCLEARCPASGWLVPLLTTRQVSKGRMAIADLVPDAKSKRYDIVIREDVSAREFTNAKQGTVIGEALVHSVDAVEYRTAIKTLRGDFRTEDGNASNRLRQWEVHDFKPRSDDLYQERLFAVQWQEDRQGRGDYTFRTVTQDDLLREQVVQDYVGKHLVEWQSKGWLPEMRIEPGDETTRLYRERGWTHWHHLFNPRQLLLGGLTLQRAGAAVATILNQALNYNSKLSMWNRHNGGGGVVQNTFSNQALNTLFDHGCRSSSTWFAILNKPHKSAKIRANSVRIKCESADSVVGPFDLCITDPPYGDAVKYEEILEFFIAWHRKTRHPEFASWVWDSRRALAIHGEDDGFRNGMVASYRNAAAQMPDNGLQVIMFTHQSTGIWSDMANIVWACGLQVTAVWYVATETDSALRQGDNVKGTNLLVVRKRREEQKTNRDDLAWELEEEVKRQVETLTGLNQQARGLYRNENLFEDADLQMAGYAAALRVLTQYEIIDGKRMSEEACRPRSKGEKTAVDSLIDFAVEVANRCLIPQGISESHWRELSPIERFYLKMIGMEAGGVSKLDNYQNFAKAFKVSDFRSVMQSAKANSSRLKSSEEFKRNDMSEGSPLHNTPLRAILYAMMELGKDLDTDDVLAHLAMNVPNYYAQGTRDLIVALCQYLGTVLESIRPDEASQARVLAQSVRNQRL